MNTLMAYKLINTSALLLSSGELGAEPVLTPELPVAAPSGQSQAEKDAYS